MKDMYTYKDLLVKIDKWLRVINAAIIGVTVFEAVLVVIIGIASNNINERAYKWVLSMSIVAYLFILAIKTAYAKNFPGSIVEELMAKKELEELKKSSSKQIVFNRYIADSINLLNSQTCALDVSDMNNHLCELGLKSGLEKLLKSLITNIGFVLDSDDSDFAIGVFIKDFAVVDSMNNISYEDGVFLFRDDLGITDNLPKDTFYNDRANGLEYDIQASIRKSFNNRSFVKQDLDGLDNELFIICNSIPMACDDNSNIGVLFIVGRRLVNYPFETSSLLDIFNRITANWVARYNDCIYNRHRSAA